MRASCRGALHTAHSALEDLFEAILARLTPPRTPHALGEWGERHARRYLEQRGYSTIATHWRSRHGEIDIVARIDATLVFVEVKTRRRATSGAFPPLAAVHRTKRARLARLARAFLRAHPARRSRTHYGEIRLDVVTVILDQPPALPDIRHYIDITGSIGCWHN